MRTIPFEIAEMHYVCKEPTLIATKQEHISGAQYDCSVKGNEVIVTITITYLSKVTSLPTYEADIFWEVADKQGLEAFLLVNP